MRKKKHFKINARNRIYDQFYVINYLVRIRQCYCAHINTHNSLTNQHNKQEPGMNWETFERERYDSDEDRKDE